MAIDIGAIIICGLMLLFAALTPLCNGLRRLRLRREESGRQQQNPSFSIIVTAHDMGEELEKSLPLFLTQDYKPYEVIVVNESSTDRTEEVLKRLQSEFKNLRTTFIPQSSHYISRKKLAMTLGVKAAHNDWIVFAEADCRPASANWLTALSRHCTPDTDIVLGYTNYEAGAKKYYRFERLLHGCYNLHNAAKGTAYGYNGNSLALRKAVFMNKNGFLKNLKYLRGEYDFLVNDYAAPGNTGIAIEPEAHMTQTAPSRKQWTNSHVYYMETRKHLDNKIRGRLLFNTDHLLLYFNYLLEAGAFAYAFRSDNLPILCTAAVAFAATLTIRLLTASKTLKYFREAIPLWVIPFFELRTIWQNASFMVRHKLADKQDFIRNN